MKMGLYSVTLAQAEDLVPLDIVDRDLILETAKASNDLMAGFFDDDFLCLVGLVRVTLLSDTAYLWMWHTDAVDHHRLMVARHARRFVARALERYEALTGFCIQPRAVAWLLSLGAEFGPEQGQGLRSFKIRRSLV